MCSVENRHGNLSHNGRGMGTAQICVSASTVCSGQISYKKIRHSRKVQVGDVALQTKIKVPRPIMVIHGEIKKNSRFRQTANVTMISPFCRSLFAVSK